MWAIVGFTSPRPVWERLGDGYRVEASFIVWEGRDVLQMPASALFRDGANWAGYVVASGRAHRRQLRPGASDGLHTQVLEGIAAGERVVVHPDERVHDGVRVAERR